MAKRFLLGNKSRALFPAIASLAGTAALILALSLGDGVQNIIDKDLSAIGKNRVLLGGDFTMRDSELLESMPFVEYASFPEEREEIKDIVFRGYSRKALEARGLKMLKDGEVILDREQFQGYAIGDRIKLATRYESREYQIRDFYTEESPFETMKRGRRVVMASESFNKIFPRSDYKNLVVSFPKESDGVDYTGIVLRELNRSRSTSERIKILETPDLYRKVERIRDFVEKGFFILSFISIGVVGFGTFNSVSQSVRDRASYIGILKAAGTSSKVLEEVFLLEGVIVVTSGALAGVVVGTISAEVIGLILNIPPEFSTIKMLRVILMALLSGVGFGILPASKVGKLEIVEALKI
ncbi:MAG: ABC transporter permease [Fusobacteriaceae bacterium]